MASVEDVDEWSGEGVDPEFAAADDDFKRAGGEDGDGLDDHSMLSNGASGSGGAGLLGITGFGPAPPPPRGAWWNGKMIGRKVDMALSSFDCKEEYSTPWVINPH